MSKFYVGQRVRVVASPYSSWWLRPGMTGVIVSSYHGGGLFGVRMDAGKPDDILGDGWGFAPYQLEPILDQKHEACDEEFKRDLDRLLERQGVAA